MPGWEEPTSLRAISSDVLRKAQQGDQEAIMTVIEVLEPCLKRGARIVGDDDAYSDLVVWLLRALRKYREPVGVFRDGIA